MVEMFLLLCFASFGIIVLLCVLWLLWCEYVSNRKDEK